VLTITVGGTVVPSTVVLFTATSLTVTFPTVLQSTPVYLPAGDLMATLTVAGLPGAGLAPTVRIARVVIEPTASINTKSIALESTQVVISGSNIGFESPIASQTLITLENSGGTSSTCISVVSLNDTSLRCNLNTSSLISGPLYVTNMRIDGVSSGSIRTQIAVVLPVPSIVESTESSTQLVSLTIYGANFSTVYPLSVAMSSSSCTITSLTSSVITCLLDPNTLDAGPLKAKVTISDGVCTSWITVALIDPSIQISFTKMPITQSVITITGSHFNLEPRNNTVSLSFDYNGAIRDCNVTQVSRTFLRCTASGKLYSGSVLASLSVLASDGQNYSAIPQRVVSFTPILNTTSVYVNASSGLITVAGRGLQGVGADVVLTYANSVRGSFDCNTLNQTWDTISCWPNLEHVTASVYSIQIAVDTGTGLESTPSYQTIAINPVLTDYTNVELPVPQEDTEFRRSVNALPDITTDTKLLNIYGNGFDTNPTNNLVVLSSGFCDVVAATADTLTCSLSSVSPGLLRARVSTNSVNSGPFVPVAEVIMGSPQISTSPSTTLPAFNGSAVVGGQGPQAKTKAGFTGGAIAGIVLASLLAILIIVTIVLAFFICRRNTGETANRLLRQARRHDSSFTSGGSTNGSKASKGSSSHNGSKRKSKKATANRRNAGQLTAEEDEFIKRLTFAQSDRDADFSSGNADYLYESSSEYQSRSDSAGDGTEEDEEEEEWEEGEEYEEDEEDGEYEEEEEGEEGEEDEDEEEEEEEEDEEEEEEEDDEEDENSVQLGGVTSKVPEKKQKAVSSSSSLEDSTDSKSSSEYLYRSDTTEEDSL
jgi:hypothetical protein